MAEPEFLAYVDETGDLGWGPKAKRIFALSAVVVHKSHEPTVRAELASMRSTFGLPADTPLQWKKLRRHEQRLWIADTIGGMPISIIQVCMFKDHLGDMNREAEALYLYSLRYLVERLTWLANQAGGSVRVRLAQIGATGERSINQYLARVRARSNKVKWDHLDSNRVFVHRPEHYELLQLGDLTAGPLHSALVATALGYVLAEYLLKISPRLWRPYGQAYPKYGFKVFPGPNPKKIAPLEAAYPVLRAVG